MTSKFAAKLSHSQAYERLFAQYLRDNGFFTLSTADFSGWTDQQVPRFNGAKRSLILPDLLAAKGGQMAWYEVKYKQCTTLHRRTGIHCLGMDLHHWRDYQRVRQAT